MVTDDIYCWQNTSVEQQHGNKKALASNGTKTDATSINIF